MINATIRHWYHRGSVYHWLTDWRQCRERVSQGRPMRGAGQGHVTCHGVTACASQDALVTAGSSRLVPADRVIIVIRYRSPIDQHRYLLDRLLEIGPRHWEIIRWLFMLFCSYAACCSLTYARTVPTRLPRHPTADSLTLLFPTAHRSFYPPLLVYPLLKASHSTSL